MKFKSFMYRGVEILFNFYGENSITVNYQGDDVFFETFGEAKRFIDSIL